MSFNKDTSRKYRVSSLNTPGISTVIMKHNTNSISKKEDVFGMILAAILMLAAVSATPEK